MQHATKLDAVRCVVREMREIDRSGGESSRDAHGYNAECGALD